MGVVDDRFLRRWEVSQAQQAPNRELDEPTLALLADVLDHRAGNALGEDERRRSADVFFLEDR